MKTFRNLFLVLALAITVSGASSISKITITGAATPADGNTLVINGLTKTWKTTPTSSTSHIQIGADLATSMVNLYSFLTNTTAASTIPNTTAYQTDSTHIVVLGALNATLTASVTGVWGIVVISSTPITQYSPTLPLSGESAALQLKEGNDLAAAIAYANTAIASSAAAMGNFVNLSLVQTIPGTKAFSGPNTYANANQLFILGKMDGTTLTNIPRADIANIFVSGGANVTGTLVVTNLAPTVRFWDTGAAADHKLMIVGASSSGFNIWFENDAGSVASNVFSIPRAGSHIGADAAYLNTTFYPFRIADTTITNTYLTNSFGGFTTAWITALGANAIGVTNTTPKIQFYDSNGLVNDKLYKWEYDSSSVDLKFYDDAENLVSTPIHVGRSAGATTTIDFNSSFLTASGSFTADAIYGTTIASTTYLFAGGVTTIPTGLVSGLYAVNGTTVTDDPFDGGGIFNPVGGEWFYRTSGASEGSGRNNRIHNRQSVIAGAGTDYTLTAATAFVDFGTTDPKVTLPTDGTYFMFAEVAVKAGANANDVFQCKLRNETDSVDLGGDQLIDHLGVNENGSMKILTTTTVAAGSKVIAIWSHNNTAARGTILSARTRIGYVRLY